MILTSFFHFWSDHKIRKIICVEYNLWPAATVSGESLHLPGPPKQWRAPPQLPKKTLHIRGSGATGRTLGPAPTHPHRGVPKATQTPQAQVHTQIVFQFMRIVFFVIHNTVRNMCAELTYMLMSSKSPNMHSVGHAGILHLSHVDRSSQTSSQIFCTGAQNHKACA